MNEKNEDVKIELVEKKAQPILSIRTRVPFENLSKTIGEVYGKIMHYMSEMGLQPSDAPFTAYYNLDMQDLDVEMGFPTASPVQGKDNIVSGELPAGRYVTYLYKGPYASMEKPYNEMFKWIEDNKLEQKGIYYEYYLNSPEQVPEEELLTRIELPLK